MTGLRAHARAVGIVLALTSLAASSGAAAPPAASAAPASPPGPPASAPPPATPAPAAAAPPPTTKPAAPKPAAKPAPHKPAPAPHKPTPAPHKPTPAPHKPTPPKPSAAKPGAPKPSAPPKPAAASVKPTAPGVAPSREEDTKGRRAVAGGSTLDDAALGAESAELGALHDAERELFPPSMPPLGAPWPKDEPSPVATEGTTPRAHSSGLPPKAPPASPEATDRDLSWLEGLEMPELPVRWDARVVRYLEFWRDDPRGHAMFATWLRRSGRYREAIRKTLAKKGLPEDLAWLAMVESGFDPKARSPVGAAGMWQFMPGTGRIYGLSQDRWADQRIHVQSATEAAADFLADLYRRFGTWELAMASYNMGYGGITGVVKKYNSNDYWALSHLEGSLPWETTLYVPKILSCAIVGRNLAKFGFQSVELEAPIVGDEVVVPPGTALATVAQAAGCKTKEVEALNPELRAGRTPPTDGPGYAVRVPQGKGAACAQGLAKQRGVPADRYVVKTGESLSDIAESHRVPASRLIELNGIAPGEVLHGGTVLLVPATAAPAAPPAPAAAPPAPATTPPDGERPVVIVPADVYVYPDRTRVFYKVKAGDSAGSLAEAFGVTTDELRRWNALDLRARLLEGMTLQVFASDREKLARTRSLSEGSVRTIVAGSEEFFAHFEEKGRRRIVVQAAAGETLESIGKRHGVSAKLMERINRRGKSEPLAAGESVVLYIAHNDGPRPGELAARADVLPLPPP